MGLDELHMYDLYTPMVKDFHMELSYDKAFDLVLEGLKPMGEDYLAKLREARVGGWIDVYPSKGKSSGAFSSGNLRVRWAWIRCRTGTMRHCWRFRAAFSASAIAALGWEFPGEKCGFWVSG